MGSADLFNQSARQARVRSPCSVVEPLRHRHRRSRIRRSSERKERNDRRAIEMSVRVQHCSGGNAMRRGVCRSRRLQRALPAHAVATYRNAVREINEGKLRMASLRCIRCRGTRVRDDVQLLFVVLVEAVTKQARSGCSDDEAPSRERVEYRRVHDRLNEEASTSSVGKRNEP